MKLGTLNYQDNPLKQYAGQTTSRIFFEGEGGDPGAGGGGGAADKAFTADGWKGRLDKDIASSPVLANFPDNAEGLLNLAKSHVSAQPFIGAEKIAIPGKDSPKEVWEQVYKKLGRPDKPDGYGYKRPSLPDKYPVDDELEGALISKAHELGLNANQLKGLTDLYYDYTSKKFTTIAEQMEADITKTDTKLRQEWGKAYTQNAALADKVMGAFGDKDFTKFLEETGMGNSPSMIRFLANVGKAISEDKLVGKPVTSFKSPNEAKAQIDKLMGDSEFIKRWTDASNPGHKAAVEEMKALHDAAYPEGEAGAA
jgi:hypothetical protein